MQIVENGLEPVIIDVVRLRKPVTGLGEKESTIIEISRELFGTHNLTAQMYARALRAFGERDLVDLIELIAQHVSDAGLLTTFDQHLPVGVGHQAAQRLDERTIAFRCRARPQTGPR